ncbi:MAG: hypothetical protein HFK09_02455 [Clostridia bacterium]|nr:hypothetical protein [Clostridia bacterium]
MNFIKEKKLNKWIVIAALYVGFAFAYYVPMRGTIALLSVNYGLPVAINNDVVAFLAAGIVPTLIYELLSSFIFKLVRTRGVLATEDMRYELRFFYLPATVVMGSIKLIFLFYPLGLTFASILVDTLVPLPFFALFMWYALKNHVDKTRYASMIYLLGSAFAVVYGVLAVLELLLGAFA